MLCFLIDVLSPDPAAEYASLKSELGAWSPRLLELPRLVAWTKADLAKPPADVAFPDDSATNVISAVSGRGLDALVNDLWERVRSAGGGDAGS